MNLFPIRLLTSTSSAATRLDAPTNKPEETRGNFIIRDDSENCEKKSRRKKQTKKPQIPTTIRILHPQYFALPQATPQGPKKLDISLIVYRLGIHRRQVGDGNHMW
jgi:hypothetical protein